MLNDPDEMPRTLLFTGNSGTGKTTFARIIALFLGANIQEINCADVRGMDDFREIVKIMKVRPLRSKYRVIVLDEVHQLPNATQDLLLKPLEDGTTSTIVILCTTNPEKLKKTIRTRCVTFACENLCNDDMTGLLRRVCKAEDIKIKKSVVEAIIEASEGSGRMALTILESIVGLPSELMLKKVRTYAGEHQAEVIELCRLIMKRATWKSIVAALKTIDGEPESVRRAILGYACACMHSNPKGAYPIANAFRDNIFDSGKQGLLIAAYEATQ
jgi:DNA polymerase III gamma/tau subunit